MSRHSTHRSQNENADVEHQKTRSQLDADALTTDSSMSPETGFVLSLRSTIGNRAMQRLLQKSSKPDLEIKSSQTREKIARSDQSNEGAESDERVESDEDTNDGLESELSRLLSEPDPDIKTILINEIAANYGVQVVEPLLQKVVGAGDDLATKAKLTDVLQQIVKQIPDEMFFEAIAAITKVPGDEAMVVLRSLICG